MTKTRKIKVLVVDDEAEFATTLADRLRLRKIDAQCVYSGAEALAKVHEQSFDVVVLDLRLPDMGGLDILPQIKAIAPGIEVILLTGHGSFEDGITGMELGAFDFIIKPIDLVLLLDKITEAHAKRSNG